MTPHRARGHAAAGLRLAPIAAFAAWLLTGGTVAADDTEPVTVRGSAQASSGKFTGAVAVRDGKLTVGGRELALEDTLYLDLQTPDIPQPPTNVLRLADGDIWRVELLGLSNRTAIVRNPQLGVRQVDLTSILSLDFLPEEAMPEMDRPGTMYRRIGPALPGDLVWIKDSDVAIESLLGVIPLPRPSLVRYALRQQDAGATVATRDALRLTDGSLYHGRLAMDGDGLALEHAVAGTLKVRIEQISHFSRHTPRIKWLSSLPNRSEPRPAPLGRPPAPEPIAPRTEDLSSVRMQALRIQSPMALRYRIPADGNGWVFQAMLAPRPSNVGDVQFRMSDGASALLERTLAPSSKPEEVTLPLRPGSELEIEVAFGDRLAFPAGVDLCDPFVRASE